MPRYQSFLGIRCNEHNTLLKDVLRRYGQMIPIDCVNNLFHSTDSPHLVRGGRGARGAAVRAGLVVFGAAGGGLSFTY